MTYDEYHRVRTYEKVIIAWSLLNDVLNLPVDPDPQNDLDRAHEYIRLWLSREKDYFETIVQ